MYIYIHTHYITLYLSCDMICVHFLLQTFYQKAIGWFQWLPSEFIKLFFFGGETYPILFGICFPSNPTFSCAPSFKSHLWNLMGFHSLWEHSQKKNHLANPKSTSPSSRNAFPPYRDARSPTPEAPMAKLTIVPWAVCSTENCWFFCETWRKCSDFLGNQYLPSGY